MAAKNYLIEGVSCTGKTSVCNELRRRGYHVIDGDEDLAYWGDPETGEPVDGYEHWIWDVDEVRARVADRSHAASFFCGGSRNSNRFIDLFDAVFVLEIDLETLNRRLARRPADQWGGPAGECEAHARLQHATREGLPEDAIAVDATSPLSRVVDAILESVGEQQPAGAAAKTTPRPVIDSVVRTVCGAGVERLVRLERDGLNEVYRGTLRSGMPVVVRIARRPGAWFTDEAHVMAQAHGVGVPTPEVLGVEQAEHDGERLSFSILRALPGRPLDELARELSAAELERLVVDSGELLARLHGVAPERGIRHELEPPDERAVARVMRVADREFGPAAAAIVERGAALVQEAVTSRPAPTPSLAHGDWLPKHLLSDGGAIVGVIDWELAGPAPRAFDLAHWEVAAGDGLYERTDLLRRGYSRVADPDVADAGWVPAFAVDFALDVLGWRNPAPRARLRRCVDVIARYVGVERGDREA